MTYYDGSSDVLTGLHAKLASLGFEAVPGRIKGRKDIRSIFGQVVHVESVDAAEGWEWVARWEAAIAQAEKGIAS